MNINIKLLDYIISVLELIDVTEKKHEAVRSQNYGAAAMLREKENEIRSKMMTIEQVRKLRDELVFELKLKG